MELFSDGISRPDSFVHSMSAIGAKWTLVGAGTNDRFGEKRTFMCQCRHGYSLTKDCGLRQKRPGSSAPTAGSVINTGPKESEALWDHIGRGRLKILVGNYAASQSSE